MLCSIVFTALPFDVTNIDGYSVSLPQVCLCINILQFCVNLLSPWRISRQVPYLLFTLFRNSASFCIVITLFESSVVLKEVPLIFDSFWWMDFRSWWDLTRMRFWILRRVGSEHPKLSQWARGPSSRSYVRERNMPFDFLNYQIW